MGTRIKTSGILCGFVTLLLATAVAAASSGTAAIDVNAIVTRMMQAQAQNRAQHTAYEVVRNYRIYKPEETNPKTNVTALVSFLPPHLKTFKIAESTGGIAERVVRNALQREVELTQDPSQSDYSPQNYDFTLLGEETLQGNRCFVLGLKPKRESKDLLEGKAWVDANSYLIRRVEGEPAKNLSWWIHDVHVTLMYNYVNGMWLRTASQASAKVRFSGDVRFSSRDVDFRPVEDVAALQDEPSPVPAYHEKSRANVRRTQRVMIPRNGVPVNEFAQSK
ncbi:MAG: hypothetical protein JWO13_1241 [Acidobacteriales bacterium]|nr:hypothetical protein [Terriglobales bacterium]